MQTFIEILVKVQLLKKGSVEKIKIYDGDKGTA